MVVRSPYAGGTAAALLCKGSLPCLRAETSEAGRWDESPLFKLPHAWFNCTQPATLHTQLLPLWVANMASKGNNSLGVKISNHLHLSPNCVPIVSQVVGENQWSDASCLALFRTDVDSQATEQKIHYGTVGYHFVFDLRLLSVWKVSIWPGQKYFL